MCLALHLGTPAGPVRTAFAVSGALRHVVAASVTSSAVAVEHTSNADVRHTDLRRVFVLANDAAYSGGYTRDADVVEAAPVESQTTDR